MSLNNRSRGPLSRRGVVARASTRTRVVDAVRRTSLRDVAARVGLSHFAILKIVRGETVRPATLEVVERWLDERHEDIARQLREVLRKAMGRLPKRKVVQVEEQVKRIVQRAYEEAGKEVPPWLVGRRPTRP